MKKVHYVTATGGAPVCSGSTPMRMKRTTDAAAVTCAKCRKFAEKQKADAAALALC